jgi:MoaA/NifB/PqqE/SkfB family radical SAM enzyme
MDTVRFLQIEPTTRCNFTCGFCCGRHMPQGDLPFDDFARALSAFPEVQHIELQGEGESLMHPRFFDMVEMARARGIRVSLITNGSYLSPEVAGRLLSAGLEKVSISLESADPDEFRRIRGGKLDKVLRGVGELVTGRNQRGFLRPVVGFSITVLRSTRGQLGAILDLYRRLGLDGGITLQPLQRMDPYVRSYAPDMAAEHLDKDEVDDLWVGHRADRRVRRIQRDKERTGVLSFFDEMMRGWRPARRTCPWLQQGLYVNQNGLVTACCMVKEERHAFGRLAKDSTKDILARRQSLRTELAAGVIPAPCKDCELARFAVMTRIKLVRFALAGMWRRLFRKHPRPALPAPVRSLPVISARADGRDPGP